MIVGAPVPTSAVEVSVDCAVSRFAALLVAFPIGWFIVVALAMTLYKHLIFPYRFELAIYYRVMPKGLVVTLGT